MGSARALDFIHKEILEEDLTWVSCSLNSGNSTLRDLKWRLHFQFQYSEIMICIRTSLLYKCTTDYHLVGCNIKSHFIFTYMTVFTFTYVLTGGPGSSVGIVTGYGLDSPGIESLLGVRFSAHVQTGPGDHPASCTMGTGSFLGIKSGRGWHWPLTPF